MSRCVDGARGEFVAALDPQGGFEVQVRQEAYQGSEIVATNTATALDVNGARVEIRGGRGLPVVLVDGVLRTESGQLPNGGTLTIGTGATNDVSVEWPDGSAVGATVFAQAGLNLSVRPTPERAKRSIGLLGSSDGDPANDVRSRDGEPIVSPSFETLYPGFADSWRVVPASSLFTYERGQSTDTVPTVTGQIGAAGSVDHGADGGESTFQRTDITPFNGLPGVRHDSRTLFLIGVFLPIGEGTTDDVDAVSGLDAVEETAPALGQLFYIGDGQTPAGVQQRFKVPEGATTMYLGFADASGFTGTPGSFDDNVGSLSVTVAAG